MPDAPGPCNRVLRVCAVIPLFVALLGLEERAPAGGENELVIPVERHTLEVLSSVTPGEAPKLRSSDAIDVITRVLEEHTDLSPRFLDPEIMTACEGTLGCIVARLPSRSGDSKPKRRLLFMLTTITRRGAPDRMIAALVDIDQAMRAIREAEGSGLHGERAEAFVAERSVILPPVRAELASSEASRAFLERLLTSDLRAAIEKEDWEPWGEIEIAADDPGLLVELDGAVVGKTPAGPTILRRVGTGRHTLVLERSDLEPERATIEVEGGHRASIRVSMRSRRSALARNLRSGLLWTGIAVAAAGVAIAGLAATSHDSDVRRYCLSGTCDLPTRIDLEAALGFGLIGLGATWSIAVSIRDVDETPWLELAAGTIAGAIAFGAAALLVPRLAQEDLRRGY
jgi:PEGA domain-containing protein